MGSDMVHTATHSPTLVEGLGLQTLTNIHPIYLLPSDPLAEEVLIPAFRKSSNVDCMAGFFSSEVLTSFAPGLATFIERSQESFRLIISPLLRQDDLTAIEDGTRSRESVAANSFDTMVVTEDLIQQHTLKCLSYLLRVGRLEIKIALMNDALFHPKVWLFQSGEDVLAVHGSSNVTYAGIKKNIEQIATSKSWADTNQQYVTEKLTCEFQRLWENKGDDCLVIPAPKAVKEKLLKTYQSDAPPTEADLKALYDRATSIDEESIPCEMPLPPTSGFSIPADLRYDDGPFEHQGHAIKAWCEAGYRGVLEMATGSGKTITAMISAHRLYENHQPLLIVVAAPYTPLIEQWCDEIALFGLKPINLKISAKDRASELQRVKRRLRTGTSSVEAIVVSHRTLCKPEFLDNIKSFDCARLLIADEAHNLGSPSFIGNPPEFFEHRLALSATPIRQYDQEGTDALFAFFGPPVFEFSLEQAIGHCLVEYDYYVHPVELTPNEMDTWFHLTGKIKQNAWRSDNGKPDEYLSKLFRDRRKLLETAEGKIIALAELLAKENLRELQHTLIYATDKEPAQLESVNSLLNEKNILFHQLTAEETNKRDETKRIIRSFQDGEIQVLTAKRVLDEGVNIPQICQAYILASTTVKRQWIQRRGRLLRTCNAIEKTHSIIHDFLALPPDLGEDIDKEARVLVRSELERAQEYARLARNIGKPDGPLTVLRNLVNVAFL